MTYQNTGLALLALATLGVDVWAIVALLRRPAWAFDAASKNKALWLMLVILGIVVCNVGFFVSLWYLTIVDPKVRAMERLGPGIGFPGA